MGLRQHPRSLIILGFPVLVLLLSGGCSLAPLPGASFPGFQPQGQADVPSGGSPPGAAPWVVAAPVPTPLPPRPVPPLAQSPLTAAMQRAGSYYERGLKAMRSGNAEQAEWEFDAALEALLDANPNGQAANRLLGATPLSSYASAPWLGALATPPRTAAPEPPASAEAEEPTLDAPALLSREDLQAMTEPGPQEATPLPEPDTAKHDIPVVFNDQVKTFIQFFQTRKWGVITRAFERASRYLPMMRKIFHEEGLPEDLLNLAFIESAVNPRATSRAKAAGIWQFMPSTGRLYGMRSTWWLDERRDPEKSTRGAAAYLKKLYDLFEDWPLALAAYNAGEGKILAAIQRQKTRDFWSLRLPQETRLFVPAFMAMTIISREPERYGFTPPPENPLEADTVRLEHPTDLALIARAAGTSVEEIRDLNPALIRWATPPDGRALTIRIPAGRRDTFLQALSRIPPAQRVSWSRHQVRKGETALGIARRYGVDVQVVLELNGLRRRQPLKAGTVLRLPGPLAGGLARAGEAEPAGRPKVTRDSPERYTVKAGDTLIRIARAHAVSLEDVRRWNNLSRDALLRPGQRLTIYRPRPVRLATAAPTPATRRYVVKRGDTLWTIARIHAVSPEDLRRWNGLSRDAALRPGQELEIRSPAS